MGGSMSPAAELYWELTSWLGIELQADGDKLRFRPAAAMTPELLRRVKRHKPELLALVRSGKTYADLAVESFLAVARAQPDGHGWYDPSEAAWLERPTAAKSPSQSQAGTLGHADRVGVTSDSGESPDGQETAVERAARYRAESQTQNVTISSADV